MEETAHRNNGMCPQATCDMIYGYGDPAMMQNGRVAANTRRRLREVDDRRRRLTEERRRLAPAKKECMEINGRQLCAVDNNVRRLSFTDELRVKGVQWLIRAPKRTLSQRLARKPKAIRKLMEKSKRKMSGTKNH